VYCGGKVTETLHIGVGPCSSLTEETRFQFLFETVVARSWRQTVLYCGPTKSKTLFSDWRLYSWKPDAYSQCRS